MPHRWLMDSWVSVILPTSLCLWGKRGNKKNSRHLLKINHALLACSVYLETMQFSMNHFCCYAVCQGSFWTSNGGDKTCPVLCDLIMDFQLQYPNQGEFSLFSELQVHSSLSEFLFHVEFFQLSTPLLLLISSRSLFFMTSVWRENMTTPRSCSGKGFYYKYIWGRAQPEVSVKVHSRERKL